MFSATEAAVEHGSQAAEHVAHAVEHASHAVEAVGALGQSQLPMLILVPLLIGCALVPGLGLWRRRIAYPATIVVLLAYLSFALTTLFKVMDEGRLRYTLAGWTPPIGIELSVDMLSAFVVSVIAVIALLVAVYAGAAVRRETPGKEVAFFGTMLVMLLGLSGMVLTGDLFNLYVFFEVSSLGGYALMAVGHKKAPVSAFRYLIMGTLGASFYLMGVGYLYVITGSLNMIDVASIITHHGANPALHVSLILMVVGLGLKMALFPMHLWLPDAYTYASSTSTAIIAPVMTKVSAYVMIRMLYFIYDSDLFLNTYPTGTIITWLAMIGVFVGSIMAIAQKDAKRMLAYSSVAQVAYIGIGIGLGNPLALVGAMLHIMNHAAMKSCLFLVTGSVAVQTGAQQLKGYEGLGRKMPWTFAGFTLAAMAMIGIPPTNGFFSKWYLVLGAIDAGQWVLVGLILASSLLTAVYFFRVLERIYAKEPAEGQGAGVHGALASMDGDPPMAMRVPVLVLSVGLLVLGLFNAWFVSKVLAQALPSGMSLPGM
ncbi:complex I subunit 5 family protein [Candidatus Eisenbacteria bacterium]|uniref:Complex I subunit 5 family protein n=1 Tax=Eiseniibacteriota bacterium TaxID=2212470 RepID=A0ABV6YKA1_UNCEI